MPIPRLSLLLSLAVITLSHTVFVEAQDFLEVSSYGASGSNHTGACSGQANTNTLSACTTDGSYDFAVGQGIRIIGGGAGTMSLPAGQPIVSSTVVNSNAATGSTTRCYMVSVADPLEGISAPSPAGCINNQPPTLSYLTIYNNLNVPSCSNAGPNPAFIWYVSTNNNDGSGASPYELLTVSGFGNGQGCYYAANAVDVGQQSTVADRGGWPTSSTSGNISKNEDFYTTISAINGQTVTTGDTLPATFTNLVIHHDDTAAVQAALNDAVSKGGADVQFEAGTYNLFRPLFRLNNSNLTNYGTSLTTAVQNGQSNTSYTYLQIPVTSPGGIVIAGRNSNGETSVIVTPPDHGGWSQLLSVGDFGRPSYGGSPAYPNPTIRISTVNKGDQKVTLVGSQSFNVGADIWLYSGSFQGVCQDVAGGTGGNNCHYSELNTVSSVTTDSNGNTVLGLTYPASKSYFATSYVDPSSGDATPNSFGLVRMPTTPHNMTLENMQINTYNPILTGGMVYGFLLSGLTLPYPAEPGPFGDGFKRDVTIQDSTWHFGKGDVSFSNSDEYDQFTNLTFNNNNIYGFAAPGAEGPFLMARVLVTEGSSQVHFTNNHFYNASINIDENTDDTISGNTLSDGIISVGTTYQNSGNCNFSSGNEYDLLFGPKTNLTVSSNTFNIDDSFQPPYVLLAGSSAGEQVTNNTLTYAGVRQVTGAFNVSAGTVSGNAINFSNGTYNYDYSGAFCASPTQQFGSNQLPQQPAYPLSLSGNTISYSGSLLYGIDLPTPGTGTTSPVCVGTNTYSYCGPEVVDPSNVHTVCSQ